MTNDLPPLGSTVWQTYELLTSPRATRELADLRGVTPATIRRHLAMLQQHGFVRTVSRPGTASVWARSDHDSDDAMRQTGPSSPSIAIQARTEPVAELATQRARNPPTEPEAQPESNTELRPRLKPKPDRTVVLLGIVGVLLGAAVIAVGIEKGKSSSFDSTPATSNLISSSPTPGSVAPTAAAVDPSVLPTPAGDRRDDLSQGGLVKIAGRTLTEEQARGYLAELHQVLGSSAFDTSGVEADLLSIGAGICNDLDAGSTRAQEIDALQVVLEVAQVEANLYYSVAVTKLCVDAAPNAAGDNR